MLYMLYYKTVLYDILTRGSASRGAYISCCIAFRVLYNTLILPKFVA